MKTIEAQRKFSRFEGTHLDPLLSQQIRTGWFTQNGFASFALALVECDDEWAFTRHCPWCGKPPIVRAFLDDGSEVCFEVVYGEGSSLEIELTLPHRCGAMAAAEQRDLDEPANIHEASACVRQLFDEYEATGNPADKAAWKRAEKQLDQFIVAALDGQEAEGYAQAERDEGRAE